MPTKEEYARHADSYRTYARNKRAEIYAPFHQKLLADAEKQITFANRSIILTDEIRYAMVASFVDGEGTVTLHTAKKSDMRQGFYIIPIVSVVNTSQEICLFIKEATDEGQIISIDPQNERWKQLYKWHSTGMRNVMNILPKIYPYLIIKREQSRAVMEYCLSRTSKQWSRTGYTQHEFELLAEVRRLNTRTRLVPATNQLPALVSSASYRPK